MRPNKKILLPLAALAIAVAGFALLVASRPQAPAQPAAEDSWPVRTLTVARTAHAPGLSLYGHLESPNDVLLTAPVQADVLELAVAEGEVVEQGQLLVRLDPTDSELLLRQREAAVAEARAQLALERQRVAADRRALANEQQLAALAGRELERAQSLVARKLGSKAGVDAARQAVERQALALNARQLAVEGAEARRAPLQARLAQAEAARDQAARDLERTALRAPFAGRIARVAVGPGQRLRPGEPVVALYDTAALRVRVKLPPEALPAVRQALAEHDRLRASGRVDGSELRLTLTGLGGTSGRGEAGVEALFAVDGRRDDLVLGRFVDVELSLPPVQDVVAVPFEALYGTDRVYRVVDERMQALRVQRVGSMAGDDGGRLALIRGSQLRDGDALVVTQIPRAMDGLRVRPVAEGEPR